MKPISKILFAGVGLVTLALGMASCRDLSVDGGKSNLTCAASSVTIENGATLKLFDQTSFSSKQLAQAFKPQATVKNVASVNLALQRVTSGAALISGGTVIVNIVADKNGVPDLQNPVGLGAVLSVSQIPTKNAGVKFTFSQPIAQLTANTTYWIVLDGSFSWVASDYIAWLGSDSSSYADGRALINSGTSTTPNWLNPDALSVNSTNRRNLAFQIGCL